MFRGFKSPVVFGFPAGLGFAGLALDPYSFSSVVGLLFWLSPTRVHVFLKREVKFSEPGSRRLWFSFYVVHLGSGFSFA